jgi:hypothetical protein
MWKQQESFPIKKLELLINCIILENGALIKHLQILLDKLFNVLIICASFCEPIRMISSEGNLFFIFIISLHQFVNDHILKSS